MKWQQVFVLYFCFSGGDSIFFSPCILPLMPVYVGILLDSDQPKTVRFMGKDISWYGLAKTLCFIAGLSTVFLVLRLRSWRSRASPLCPLVSLRSRWYCHSIGNSPDGESLISSSCKTKRASNLKRIVKEVIF